MMLIAIGTYIVFGAWIYGWYTRFQHSARVCSGEFLKPGESTEKYLIQGGAFLYYSFLLTLVTFAMAFLCGLITLLATCCLG